MGLAVLGLPVVAGAQGAAPAAAQPFALVTAPPPAAAHVDIDLRCLELGLIMSSSQDPQAQAYGSGVVTYFLGRVDGRGGKGNLEAKLSAEFAATKGAPDLSQQAGACVQILGKRNAEFRTVAIQLLKKYGKPVSAPAGGAHPAH